MARPATPALSPRATFLFSSAGEHRDLHSFPTRRSSDLAGPPREGRAAFVRARRTPRGARRRVLGLARHGGLPARSADAALREGARRPAHLSRGFFSKNRRFSVVDPSNPLSGELRESLKLS